MNQNDTPSLIARTSLGSLKVVVNSTDDPELGRYMYAEMQRLTHLLRVKHKFALKQKKNVVESSVR